MLNANAHSAAWEASPTANLWTSPVPRTTGNKRVKTLPALGEIVFPKQRLQ